MQIELFDLMLTRYQDLIYSMCCWCAGKVDICQYCSKCTIEHIFFASAKRHTEVELCFKKRNE